MQTGRVAAVCASSMRGTAKTPLPAARLIEGSGVEGDAHAGRADRQVSILSSESLERMRSAARDPSLVVHGCCGENLDLDGVAIRSLLPGVLLEIVPSDRQAASVLLRVTEMGKPERKGSADAVIPGNLFPGEGAFAEVARGGTVTPGDSVRFAREGDPGFNFGVMVVSDSCARGEREDGSGPLAIQLLRERGLTPARYAVVADEMESIRLLLSRWCDDGSVDLVVTSGGTGVAPRDVTPEATLSVLEREVRGIPELIRAESARETSTACLSRAVAGLRSGTLVINLPGSMTAVRQALGIVAPFLDHALLKASGDPTPCGDRPLPGKGGPAEP